MFALRCAHGPAAQRPDVPPEQALRQAEQSVKEADALLAQLQATEAEARLDAAAAELKHPGLQGRAEAQTLAQRVATLRQSLPEVRKKEAAEKAAQWREETDTLRAQLETQLKQLRASRSAAALDLVEASSARLEKRLDDAPRDAGDADQSERLEAGRTLLGEAKAAVAAQRSALEIETAQSELAQAKNSAAQKLEEARASDADETHIQAARESIAAWRKRLQAAETITADAPFTRFLKQEAAAIDRTESALKKTEMALAEQQAVAELNALTAAARLASTRLPKRSTDELSLATDAVAALRKGLDGHAELEKQDPRYRRVAQKSRREADRIDAALQKEMLRRNVERVQAAWRAHQDALRAPIEDLDQVEGAAREWEKAIDAEAALIAQSPVLARTARGMRQAIAALRIDLKDRRAEAELEALAVQLEAAKKKVTEPLTTAQETQEAPIEDEHLAAQRALAAALPAYQTAIRCAAEQSQSTAPSAGDDKAPRCEKAVETAGRRGRRALARFAQTIRTHRRSLQDAERWAQRLRRQSAVARHQAKLDAQLQDAEAKLGAISSTEQAPYESARDSVVALEQTIEAAPPEAAADRGHQKTLRAMRQKAKALFRRIAQTWVARFVESVDTQIAGLAKAEEDLPFHEAKLTVSALRRAHETVAKLPAADGAYQRWHRGLTGQIARYERRIAGLDIARKIARHERTVAEVHDPLLAQLKLFDTEPEQPNFDRAGALIDALEKRLKESESIAQLDRRYARKLRQLTARVPSYRQKLEGFRVRHGASMHRREVAEKQKAVDAALAALQPQSEDTAFAAARDAVSSLTTAADAVPPPAQSDRKHLAWIAGVKKKLPTYKALIERQHTRKLALAREAALAEQATEFEASLSALASDTPDFAAAETKLGAWRDALKRAEEDPLADPKHRATLKAMRRAEAQASRRLAQKQSAHAESAHQAATDEAAAAALAAVAATDEADTPDDPRFATAHETLRAAETKLADVPASARRGHRKALQKTARNLAQLKRRLETHQRAVRVTVARARLQSTVERLGLAIQNIQDLGEGSTQTAYQAVEALEAAVEATAPIAEQDRDFARFLGQMKRAASASRRQIPLQRVDVARREAEAALQALTEDSPDPAFETVAPRLAALAAEIDRARGQEGTPARYRRFLLQSDRAHRSLATQTARLRLRARIKQHQTAVLALRSAAEEQVAGLGAGAEAERYDEARAQIQALEQRAAEGQSLAGQDRKYGQFLQEVQRYADTLRKRADAAEHQQAVEAHQGILLEATRAAEAAVNQVDENAAPEVFPAAREAVQAWQAAVAGGAALRKTDRHYDRYLTSLEKKIARAEAKIAATEQANWIKRHRTNVEVAASHVAESLEELRGATEPEAFQRASQAITALGRELEQPIGPNQNFEAPKKYRRFLTALQNKIPAYRKQVFARRRALALDAHLAQVAAAEEQAAQSVASLEGAAPDDERFAAAKTSLAALAETIEAAPKDARPTAAYRKQIAATEKRSAALAKRIDARRRALRAEQHAARAQELNDQLKNLTEALQGERREGLFDEAQAAAAALRAHLEAGAPIAEAWRPYQKTLRAMEKQLGQDERRIRAAIYRAKVDDRRQALAAETAELDAALDALSTTDAALYERAETQVDQVRSVAARIQSDFPRDRALQKLGRATEAKLASARQEIRIRRIQAHQAEAEAAIAAIDDDGTPDAAEAALRRFDHSIDAAKKLKTADRSYTKALAAFQKQAARGQRALTQKRLAKEIWQHRAQLDPARETLIEHLEQIASEPSPKLFAKARRAIAELDRIRSEGEPIAARSKAHQKRLATVQQELRAATKQLAQAELELEIRPHRESLAAALAELKARQTALEAEPSGAAHAAVRDQAKAALEAIEGGAPFAKKSRAYRRHLTRSEKKTKATIAQADRTWRRFQAAQYRAALDAARTEVEQAVAAIEEGADEAARSRLTEARTALKAKLETDQAAARGKALRPARRAAETILQAADRAAHLAELRARQDRVDESLRAFRKAPSEASLKALVDTIEANQANAPRPIRIARTHRQDRRTQAKLIQQAKAWPARLKAARRQLARQTALAALSEATEKARTAVASAVEAGTEAAQSAADGELQNLAARTAEPSRDRTIQRAQKRARQTLAKLRQSLRRAQKRAEIEKRTIALDEAHHALEQALVGLERGESDDYQGAEDRVSALRQALSESDALKGARKDFDRKTKTLAQASRAARRRIRIAQLTRAGAEAKAAVEGAQSDDAFRSAERALRQYSNTVRSNKDFPEKSRAYTKTWRIHQKQAARLSRGLTQRRKQIALDAHRAKLTQAMAAATTALKETKQAPSESRVADAEAALRRAEHEIAGGEPQAKIHRSYRRTLAQHRRTVRAGLGQLNRLRFQAESAEHRTALTAAQESAQRAVAATKDEPSDERFGESRAALDALAEVLDQGKGLAGKNRRYKRKLAAARKQLRRWRNIVAARRRNLARDEADRTLVAAKSAAEDKAKALAKDPTTERYQAARDALGAWRSATRAARAVHPKRRATRRRWRAEGRAQAKLARRIRRHRSEAQLASARNDLGQSYRAADQALGAVKGTPSPREIDAARASVRAFRKTLRAHTPLKKAGRAGRKLWKKGLRQKAGLTRRLQRIELAQFVGPHQEETRVALKATQGALRTMRREPSEESYRAAEAAIDRLDLTVRRGRPLAKKHRAYRAQLTRAGRKLKAAKRRLQRLARTAFARKLRADLEGGWKRYRAEARRTKKRGALLEDYEAALAAGSDLRATMKKARRRGVHKVAKYRRSERKIARRFKKSYAKLKKAHLARLIGAHLKELRSARARLQRTLRAKERDEASIRDAALELSQVLRDGAKLSRKSKAYAREERRAKKQLKRARRKLDAPREAFGYRPVPAPTAP